MNCIYHIGNPLEPDKPHQLGNQAGALLQLAGLDVRYLPGFLVSMDDLTSDFEAAFNTILKSGIPVLQNTVRRFANTGDSQLPLEVSLLPDIRLEPNPRKWLADDTPHQLMGAVKAFTTDYRADLSNNSIPAAVMIRYFPGGNNAGSCLVNRNPDSGIRRSIDLPQLKDSEVTCLEDAATRIEHWYLDLRQITYIIDSGRIWITDQGPVTRSVQAHLRLLAELFEAGSISAEKYLNAVKPAELRSLFQLMVIPSSVTDFTQITGGIAGSFGAGRGRVFFSAKKLVEAHKQAKPREREFILLTRTTHVDDLEALRLSHGVITGQGGYTSHAPIIARHLGKPAIIIPDIVHQIDTVTIQGKTITEGEWITLSVPPDAPAAIYTGKGLIQPADYDDSILSPILEQARIACRATQIRANADTVEEARLANRFKADGIGLCRTEHMIREGEQLRNLQHLLFDNSDKETPERLTSLGSHFENLFKELFRVLNGKPLTIRLLDAPLHEFLPDQHRESQWETPTNPMLGYRGCRRGMMYPALYEMQIRALLAAALDVHLNEGITVHPDLLIPFVTSHRELAIIKQGAETADHTITGLNTIIREAVEAAGLETLPFPLRTGAVIEVPAAAITAAKLVYQAEIISFGTNDLTQTTLGISRDNMGSLQQLYEELNIWEGDPFQDLVEPVRKQIETAVKTARAVRPDLETGICGEAGYQLTTIQFAIDQNIDYISCPVLEIPAAMLTAAQLQLGRK